MISFNSENRLIKILNLLNKNNSVTANYIANKLGVSTKTVKNDIKELNELLKEIGLIEVKQGEYVLYIFDNSALEGLYHEIAKYDYVFSSSDNRMTYMLYKLLNSKKAYLTEDLAEEMNVGRTTLIGDLKRLRSELESYNIAIKGKTNDGLHLIGNEINIRGYVLEKMYKHIYNRTVLDEDIIELIREAAYDKGFATESVDLLVRYYTVSLDRLINGYTLDNLGEEFMNLENTSAFKFIDYLSDKIEKRIHIIIPKSERLFITLPVVGMRTPIIGEGTGELEVSDEAVELVQEIIDYVKKEINISITPGDLFQDFVYHINFMLNRLKYNIKVENSVIDEIKDKYPVAYKIAEIVGELIYEKVNLIVNEDELGFLAMYFGVFITENNNQKSRISKVAIICSTGRVTARLIGNQLKKILTSHVEIDLYAENEINNQLIKKYDLIVTTINIKLNTDIPIIHLKEIFNENELRRKLHRVKYNKQLEMPICKGIESVLLSMLNDENFFVLDNKLSYMENTNKMVDAIYERGLVDEGFKARLREREKNSTMVFDKNIALPHTINYKGDKPILTLGVLEHSNYLDENDLKLIFLLALPENSDEDETILVRIYNEIISIANDKEVITEISKLKSYKELVLYFIKEKHTFFIEKRLDK